VLAAGGGLFGASAPASSAPFGFGASSGSAFGASSTPAFGGEGVWIVVKTWVWRGGEGGDAAVGRPLGPAAHQLLVVRGVGGRGGGGPGGQLDGSPI